MIIRAFTAMGTDWWLTAGAADALADAERFVRDVESRLSRFRESSSLSELNARRQSRDPLLAAVVSEALALRAGTGGSFDPTLGDAVISAGYARSFDRLDASVIPDGRPDLRPVVEVDGDRVFLHGRGSLDLGGIAKGWTVDRVAERLGEVFLVDGGGDIRCGGPRAWVVGAPGDRALSLTDVAVATSSTGARRWETPAGPAHHIICPISGRPSKGTATAVVVARSAAVADAFATALVADPRRATSGLDAYGAQALLETDTWWMTLGMERWLV